VYVYRFLPEEIFVSRWFHLSLLAAQLLVLASSAPYWWRFLTTYSKLKVRPRVTVNVGESGLFRPYRNKPLHKPLQKPDPVPILEKKTESISDPNG
jgi:ALG3 protein